MKPGLLFFALALSGCTITTIEAPSLKMRRVSFLQKIEVPSLVITTNGAVTLKGYKNDGGGGVISDTVGAAVSAALKAQGL